MLRVSSNVTNREIDLAMVNGESVATSEIPYANELMNFAGAVASFDETRLAEARDALLTAAGPGVLVDAAGVAANFQRMVRIADSTGIPVDVLDNDMINQIRDDLDLYRFPGAENSTSR